MLVPYVENATCVTYTLDMVANVNYNLVLVEDLCDLHAGHGSEHGVQCCIAGSHVTYILDTEATRGLHFFIAGKPV